MSSAVQTLPHTLLSLHRLEITRTSLSLNLTAIAAMASIPVSHMLVTHDRGQGADGKLFYLLEEESEMPESSLNSATQACSFDLFHEQDSGLEIHQTYSTCEDAQWRELTRRHCTGLTMQSMIPADWDTPASSPLSHTTPGCWSNPASSRSPYQLPGDWCSPASLPAPYLPPGCWSSLVNDGASLCRPEEAWSVPPPLTDSSDCTLTEVAICEAVAESPAYAPFPAIRTTRLSHAEANPSAYGLQQQPGGAATERVPVAVDEPVKPAQPHPSFKSDDKGLARLIEVETLLFLHGLSEL